MRVDNAANFSCVKYVDRFGVRWAFIYYVVALIWNSEVVLAGQHFIVAGAVSAWYFERYSTRLYSLREQFLRICDQINKFD